MDNEKMPADWAIEKAREIMGLSTHYIAGQAFSAGILAFARYIEAHEEPPVDRKLRVAREVVARMYPGGRDGIERGEWDSDGIVIGVQSAITLWEQGFAK